MTEEMHLRATLIPVGRDINAKPGDKLMIVAGLCIGVYTGAVASQPVALKPPDPRMSPLPDKPQTDATRYAGANLKNLILQTVQAKPGLHTTHLLDLAGIPRDNTVRVRAHTALRLLVDKKHLIAREQPGKPRSCGMLYWPAEEGAQDAVQ